jgi:hypothetical protein
MPESNNHRCMCGGTGWDGCDVRPQSTRLLLDLQLVERLRLALQSDPLSPTLANVLHREAPALGLSRLLAIETVQRSPAPTTQLPKEIIHARQAP